MRYRRLVRDYERHAGNHGAALVVTHEPPVAHQPAKSPLDNPRRRTTWKECGLVR